MVRDLFNKSKLTDEEIRIAEKVLACDHYTPSKVCVLLYKINQLITERFICNTVMYILSLLIALVVAPPCYNIVALIKLILCTYPLMYLMYYTLIDDVQVKIIMMWLKKIF